MKVSGLNVNLADANGDTALHLAVQGNLCDNVKTLLQLKETEGMEHKCERPETAVCNVNAANKKRRTPLHIAARDNYAPEILQLLIKCGADVTAVDRLSNIPLHYAAGNRLEIVKGLLHAKAGGGHRGADRGVVDGSVNAKNSKGRTPLHESARRNERRIVVFLLDNGSHVNAVDQFGRTSLHYAATHHSSDTVKVSRLRFKVWATGWLAFECWSRLGLELCFFQYQRSVFRKDIFFNSVSISRFSFKRNFK